MPILLLLLGIFWPASPTMAHTDGGTVLAENIVAMWEYVHERREGLDRISVDSEFDYDGAHPKRSLSHLCLDRLIKLTGYENFALLGYVPAVHFGKGFQLSYQNKKIKNVAAVYDPALLSFRYQTVPSRVPQKARVSFSLWHGYGAKGSHAGLLPSEAIPVLTDENNSTQLKAREILVKDGLEWIPAAAEAVDLPESGNGFITWPHLWGVPGNPFHTLGSTCSRASHYLRAHRSTRQDLIEVVAARSAAAGIAAETNFRHPGSVDAMVFSGPLHPDPEIGFQFSVDTYEHLVAKKKMIPNRTAFDWVNYMYSGMRWHKQSRPFGSTPVLILVGEFDNEMSPKSKEWFKHLSETQPNIRFVEIPGAGHDVFLSRRALTKEKHGVDRPSYSPVVAYVEIQRFLNELVIPSKPLTLY